MKSWLQKIAIEVCSIHSEGKSVVAKRFIETLKKQNFKIHDFHFKNVYIDQLDNIANKYKRTYHNTNKMKPADVKVNK